MSSESQKVRHAHRSATQIQKQVELLAQQLEEVHAQLEMLPGAELQGDLRQWAIRTMEQGARSSEPPSFDQLAYLATLMRNGLSALEFWVADSGAADGPAGPVYRR